MHIIDIHIHKYKYKLVCSGRSLSGRFGRLSQDCQPWFRESLGLFASGGTSYLFSGTRFNKTASFLTNRTLISVCFGVKRPAIIRRHTTRVIGFFTHIYIHIYSWAQRRSCCWALPFWPVGTPSPFVPVRSFYYGGPQLIAPNIVSKNG